MTLLIITAGEVTFAKANQPQYNCTHCSALHISNVNSEDLVCSTSAVSAEEPAVHLTHTTNGIPNFTMGSLNLCE